VRWPNFEAGKGRACTSSSTAAWAASARVDAELTQCRRRLGYACFNGVARERKRLLTEDVAAQLGTINYEVTMGISGRVPRWYHEDDAETLV